MTTKAYLSQAYRLEQQINSKVETLNSLKQLALKDTGGFSLTPGSPNKDKQTMADIICKIVDLENEINAYIDKLIDLKTDMYHAFQKVENVDYRLILEKRYLCNKSWEEIAVDLEIGLRWLYKLHDSAVSEVEKYIIVH